MSHSRSERDLRPPVGARVLRLAAGPAVVVLFATAWFAPFEIGGTLRLDATVFAARTWTIERSGQGAVSAFLRDREAGVFPEVVLQSADRGDAATFSLAPGIRAGRSVEAGDTIAVLRSGMLDALVAELEGARRVAESEALAVAAGEKEEMIQELRVRLGATNELLSVQRRIVERMAALVERAGESVIELDRAQVSVTQLEGQADLIRAQIAVLETGARPEDRLVAMAALEAAQGHLESVLAQRERHVVRSPIAGVVSRPPTDSVLVAVTDTTAWVVVATVPVDRRGAVRPGQAGIVQAGSAEAFVTVLDVEPTLTPGASRPSVLLTLRADGPLTGAVSGMRGEVRVETPPETLRAWIVRNAGSLFRFEQFLANRPAG